MVKRTILCCSAIGLCSFVAKQTNNTLGSELLKGRVKTMIEYDRHMVDSKEEVYSVSIHAYDMHGNEVADTSYAHDGKMSTGRYTNVYNDAGIRSERMAYSNAGTVAEHIWYGYDKQGRLTGEKMQKETVPGQGTYVYRYNIKGDTTIVKHYNAEGQAGDSIIRTYKPGGMLQRVITKEAVTSFVYDDTGRLVKHTFHETNGMVMDVLYEKPDAHGNATEKTIVYFKQGKNDTAWYRRIFTYY